MPVSEPVKIIRSSPQNNAGIKNQWVTKPALRAQFSCHGLGFFDLTTYKLLGYLAF
jgi:hypothetical protein